jgi:Ala-tRNA(Pro) deacylase
MVAISHRLTALLEENGVAYEVLHHTPEFTAQETAAHTHTPGREFAKVVIVQADGRFAMLVLPAHHRVDYRKVNTALGATEVSIATEEQTRDLFPDCEVGAEPPLGRLYDLPVWMSDAMKGDRHITFNAGTHEDVIRISFEDFTRLAVPWFADFSVRR